MTKKRTTRKGWITAEELMAELNADPDYQARIRARDEELERRLAEWRRAEAPLVAELQAAGYTVDTVWDLVECGRPYHSALPILVAHLSRPYPSAVREWIVRALAVPEAKFAWDLLKSEFCKETDKLTKDGFADTLSQLAGDEELDDVIALLRDRSLGTSRGFLLVVLERSKDPRAKEVLLELAAEPDLKLEVERILRKLAARERRARKRREAAQLHKLATLPPIEELTEMSTDFDLDMVKPFLQRFSKLVSGLGRTEIKMVGELAEELDIEGEDQLAFEVKHRGEMVPLRILVYLDDVDTVGLYFFTTPALAEAIGKLIEEFCEDHGM